MRFAKNILTALLFLCGSSKLGAKIPEKKTAIDFEAFFKNNGVQYSSLNRVLKLGGDSKTLRYLQIYDRPNDDPEQNQSSLEKYEIPQGKFYAYSTAKIILSLTFHPREDNSFDVNLQWAAQMMVGQNTEGGRGCYLEFQNSKYSIEINYPQGVTQESMTHEKIGSVLYTKPIALGVMKRQAGNKLEGELKLKRGAHTHYFIRYQVEAKADDFSVQLKTSHENPSFPEYDLYLFATATPNAIHSKKSIYFMRPNDIIYQPELIGDGDVEIATRFVKANCLECHGGNDPEKGREFSVENNLPLYPEKIHTSLGWLAEINDTRHREEAIENMKNKWPAGMRRAVSTLLSEGDDRKLILRWLMEAIQKTKSTATHQR